jgi:drug/metabolite transporter (DMT)-like permease
VPASDLANSALKSRRWSVIFSGLLCCGLALVVLYTKRNAFFSPLAIVVVAAIGLVAVLLQLRFYNKARSHSVQAPGWLNVLGILFAVAALFADRLRLSAELAQMMALGAVSIFAISSAMILHAFRKRRTMTK